MEFLTEAQRLREELNDLSEAFEELKKENEYLSNSNDWYEEKLSAFIDGITIEKAKELDLVLITCWDQSSSDGQLWRSYKKAEVAVVRWMSVPYLNWAGEHHWFDENNGVIYKNPKAFFMPPLPSETKEGS